MSRRCSHCGNDGHNSRTCPDSRGVFKLFGVRLSTESCMASSPPGAASECADMSMRKCASMGNLCNYGDPEGRASSPTASQFEQYGLGDPVEGYASDDLVHTNSSSRERKKGVPWTEEEHRSFLTGLQTLGKGDWRGISRNFVRTRTPTQVASHAQKYFMRKNNINKRRRRSSLFDINPDSVPIVLEQPVLEERSCADPEVSAELSLGQCIPHGPSFALEVSRLAGHGYPSESLPALALCLPLAHVPSGTSDLIRVPGKPSERKAMEVTAKGTLRQFDVDVMEVVPESVDAMEGTDNMLQSNAVIGVTTLWPGEYIYGASKPEPMDADFKILKPIPIILNPRQNADETSKFPELTINVARRVMEPTPLSFKLLADRSRLSAFHVTVPKSGSRDVDGQGGLSSAISVP